MTIPDRNACLALDAADPVAGFRDRFTLPQNLIYLDGNSLGPLPRALPEHMAKVVSGQWGEGLIRSWSSAGWIAQPFHLGDRIARLVGAKPGEVVVADSTSINLFKLLTAALRLRPDRKIILSEAGNFPTDLYVAEGAVEALGAGHQLHLVEAGDLVSSIDKDTAVVMLTHVDFRSGRMHDMKAMTTAAHDAGALILWDLAHSAGAVPVALNGVKADLAVGCGYKYLNGGPGAPAFLFVAERLQEEIRPALSGWMGHATPFAFTPHYAPAPGIARNLCGTPPVLSMAALDCALDIWDDVDMQSLRTKSEALCELFIDLVEDRCAGFGLELASPRQPELRGSQVSFSHGEGYAVMQALIASGVIGDFREPNLLRFGFAPLYIRYADVWDAVDILQQVLADEAWNRPEFKERRAVT